MKKLLYLFSFLFITIALAAQQDASIQLVQNESTYRVMSFNIRYNNSSDGVFKWKNRRELAVQMIQENNVDILGVQEALNSQMSYLNKNLTHHNFVGVGRANGKKRGEFSAIFYDTNRFTAIDKGNFWLSETPEKRGSKGWDAAIERIASWVILADKASSDTLFVLNTHFDHRGEQARLESAKLIMSKVDSITRSTLNYPIIIMGDLNSTPDSNVISEITKGDNPLQLNDSWHRAHRRVGIDGTFHAFGGRKPADRARIDYIFTNNLLEVLQYETIGDEPIDGMWISDHSAIMATVRLKRVWILQ